jgi:hypothetical protein
MSEDYLFKAVDTVMRKTMAARERQLNQEHAASLYAVGLAEETPGSPLDEALADEDERTLEKVVAALAEIRNSDTKENTQDG